MITYSKNYSGLHLLLRIYGSSVPRAIWLAFLTTLQTGLLHAYARTWIDSLWGHPWAFSTFAYVVGFAVVFRSNYGYHRYWEGRGSLATMSARWADFATQAMTFDRSGYYLSPGEPLPEDHAQFVERLFHLLSLLHGLALQHLRGDWSLQNLSQHQPQLGPPPVDAAGLPGYNNHLSVVDLFMLRGTIDRLQHYNRLSPLGVIGQLTPDEYEGLGRRLEKLGCVTTETALTGKDHRRENRVTTCGHGVDTVCIRLMQLSTGVYVPGASERVQVVYAWVHDLLMWRMRNGGLNVPPPIATRMYQLLSEGMLAFEGARKLSDTPFPFPWAQLLLLLLMMFALLQPFLVVAYVTSLWMACVLNFVTVLSYVALNEVARDLEDPFVYDPNDLALCRMQFQFNERLLSMALSPFNRGLLNAQEQQQLAQQQQREQEQQQQQQKEQQQREQQQKDLEQQQKDEEELLQVEHSLPPLKNLQQQQQQAVANGQQSPTHKLQQARWQAGDESPILPAPPAPFPQQQAPQQQQGPQQQPRRSMDKQQQPRRSMDKQQQPRRSIDKQQQPRRSMDVVRMQRQRYSEDDGESWAPYSRDLARAQSPPGPMWSLDKVANEDGPARVSGSGGGGAGGEEIRMHSHRLWGSQGRDTDWVRRRSLDTRSGGARSEEAASGAAAGMASRRAGEGTEEGSREGSTALHRRSALLRQRSV